MPGQNGQNVTKYVAVDKDKKLFLSETISSDKFVFKSDRSDMEYKYLHLHVDNEEKKMVVHPSDGDKADGEFLVLRKGLSGENTICYPFDYDEKRCIIAGGNDYFVKRNKNNDLVWSKYYDWKPNSDPFLKGNSDAFLFEMEFTASEAGVEPASNSPATSPDSKESTLEFIKLDDPTVKVRERLFPTNYLVDEVEERKPYNGKNTKLFKDTGFLFKTIANKSITKRMFLITANVKELEFTFSDNPFDDFKGELQLGFQQLTQVKLGNDNVFNESIAEKKEVSAAEVKVSNTEGNTGVAEVKVSNESDAKNTEGNEPTCKAEHTIFDTFEIQCVLSLQPDSRNVKHICYLKLTAKGQKDIELGKPLDGGLVEKNTNGTIEYLYFAFPVETLQGPLVLTGIGIDEYCGFVFQVAHLLTSKTAKLSDRELLNECFYSTSGSRLCPAGIKDYSFFESNKKDQSGYPDMAMNHSSHIVRNLFREIAVEDDLPMILFQQLNYLYPEITLEPKNKVLPSMLHILEKCFAEGNIGLIQSVIRIDHIKCDEDNVFITPHVRKIWSEFAKKIRIVKQYVLERPALNMIECAILSESWRDKWWAVLVDFSVVMSFVAVFLTGTKMSKQIEDQRKFTAIFTDSISLSQEWKWPNWILHYIDFLVNVVLSVITVLVTFLLISGSEKVVDLVVNCLAITFIVELDEDMNHRDPVEINDLVLDWIRKQLLLVEVQQSKKVESSLADQIREKIRRNFQDLVKWIWDQLSIHFVKPLQEVADKIREKIRRNFQDLVKWIWDQLLLHFVKPLQEVADKIREKILRHVVVAYVVKQSQKVAGPIREKGSKLVDWILSPEKAKGLADLLVSADYVSLFGKKSKEQENLPTEEEILTIVQKYINEGNQLPVLNRTFRGDPYPGKPKFLVLTFQDGKKKTSFRVREKLAVDFSEIEILLKSKNGSEKVLDLVGCKLSMAITFIVELDEDMNHPDPVLR
eukprot:gene29664-38791_t